MPFAIPFSGIFLRLQRVFGVQGGAVADPYMGNTIVPTMNVTEYLGPLYGYNANVNISAGNALMYTVPAGKTLYLKSCSRDAAGGTSVGFFVYPTAGQFPGSGAGSQIIFLGPRQAAASFQYFETPVKLGPGSTINVAQGAGGDASIPCTISGYLVDSSSNDP